MFNYIKLNVTNVLPGYIHVHVVDWPLTAITSLHTGTVPGTCTRMYVMYMYIMHVQCTTYVSYVGMKVLVAAGSITKIAVTICMWLPFHCRFCFLPAITRTLTVGSKEVLFTYMYQHIAHMSHAF